MAQSLALSQLVCLCRITAFTGFRVGESAPMPITGQHLSRHSSLLRLVNVGRPVDTLDFLQASLESGPKMHQRPERATATVGTGAIRIVPASGINRKQESPS
jgi:hypothetical protein